MYLTDDPMLVNSVRDREKLANCIFESLSVTIRVRGIRGGTIIKALDPEENSLEEGESLRQRLFLRRR